MDEDYVAQISFEGLHDGEQVIIFDLRPKPDATVVWGKLELMVIKKYYLPVYEKYYDEDIKLM